MKKNIVLVWGLILGLTFTMQSCKDDDDDESVAAEPVAEASYVGGSKNGKQVAGVGGYEFVYSSDGILKSIKTPSSDRNTYKVTTDPLEIKVTGDFETTTFSNFAFNSAGYITRLTIKLEESDRDYKSILSLTYSYSYNSRGQMTSGSFSGSGESKDNEASESASTSGSFSIKWEDGSISSSELKCNFSGTEIYEGKKYKQTDKVTATSEFTIGKTENKYHQLTNELSGLIISSDLIEELSLPVYELFATLGWFGKGGDYYPTKREFEAEITETDEGETKTYSGKETYTYTVSVDDEGYLTYVSNFGSLGYND